MKAIKKNDSVNLMQVDWEKIRRNFLRSAKNPERSKSALFEFYVRRPLLGMPSKLIKVKKP